MAAGGAPWDDSRLTAGEAAGSALGASGLLALGASGSSDSLVALALSEDSSSFAVSSG